MGPVPEVMSIPRQQRKDNSLDQGTIDHVEDPEKELRSLQSRSTGSGE